MFVVFIDLVIIISFIYVTIKTIQHKNIIAKQKMNIKNLEQYNKTLLTRYNSVKGFQHDFSNFVVALNGYAATDNIEGIKSMSKSILNECAEVNKMGVFDPKIISNPAIYSLLTNKYYLAREQNINMNIEILEKLDETKEKSYEICRILGILLDNAIDAAKNSDEKRINIQILKDEKVDRKIIIIENSYTDKNVDINKIFEKGYSSKNNDKEEHGLGLWNVKCILMKNEDLNLYTTADEMFKQQLEIY